MDIFFFLFAFCFVDVLSNQSWWIFPHIAETQSYVLNFHGRVTQASVKNFQIVHDNDGKTINYYITDKVLLFFLILKT